MMMHDDDARKDDADKKVLDVMGNRSHGGESRWKPESRSDGWTKVRCGNGGGGPDGGSGQKVRGPPRRRQSHPRAPQPNEITSWMHIEELGSGKDG